MFEAFIQVIFLLFNVGPILLSRKPWFVGGGRRRGHLYGQKVFVKRNLYETVAETQVLYFNLKALEKGEGTEGQIDHLQRPDGWGKRPVIFLLLLLFFSTRTYAKARRASPGAEDGRRSARAAPPTQSICQCLDCAYARGRGGRGGGGGGGGPTWTNSVSTFRQRKGKKKKRTGDRHFRHPAPAAKGPTRCVPYVLLSYQKEAPAPAAPCTYVTE